MPNVLLCTLLFYLFYLFFRIGDVSASYESIQKQLEEHRKLQTEFEAREAFISDFIYVVPNTSSPSQDQDLEGQVMAVAERWDVLCSWIEGRWKTLNEMAILWGQLEDDHNRLKEWLDGVEKALKLMESSPTEEFGQLTQQTKHIKVRKKLYKHLENILEVQKFDIVLKK